MIRNSVKIYIKNAKEAYKSNRLDIGVENWNKIYDELEDDDCGTELYEAMACFTNDEVFGITEHFKIMVGYYS